MHEDILNRLKSFTAVVPVSPPIEPEVSPPLEADQGEEGVGAQLLLGQLLVTRLLVDLLVDVLRVLRVALLAPLHHREPVHCLPPPHGLLVTMSPGLRVTDPGSPALVDTRPLGSGSLLGRSQGQRPPVRLR